MTYAEMLDKIQSAGAWFVGSFMGEFLVRHNDYNIDSASRVAFINYIHEEYGKNLDYSFDSTKTKCYALMSIINGGRVMDALEHVINCNEKKVPEDAIHNAMELIDAIVKGKILLP